MIGLVLLIIFISIVCTAVFTFSDTTKPFTTTQRWLMRPAVGILPAIFAGKKRMIFRWIRGILTTLYTAGTI